MRGRIAYSALVALLVGASIGLQFLLAAKRPVIFGSTLAEGAFAAFGGIRSIVAEIVWFRADRLQDEGRYVELAQLAHALTLTEPHTPEVWSYAAWNLAYNVSVMMPTEADRWRWVESALRLLRDSGLRYNPASADLHFELSQLFEMKLGLDLDDAAPHYRARWREIVEDVAARGSWQEDLKMDPVRMAALERHFQVTDRTDPLYSALYWALRGLEVARSRREEGKLNELVRQSFALYFKKRGVKVPPNG